MEKTVIADTDVVIDFFSGIEPVASMVADLIDQDGLALTTVSVFELYTGISGKKRLKQIDDLVSIIQFTPFFLFSPLTVNNIDFTKKCICNTILT